MEYLSNVDTLVFGGGGVKSIAYLGAVEEIVRQGVEWDDFLKNVTTVAGASAGSFSAACVASGKTIDELNVLLVDFDSSKLL